MVDGFQRVLRVLGDEHIDLVITLEELDVQLDRLLLKEDLLESVVNRPRFLNCRSAHTQHVFEKLLTVSP